MEKNKEECVNKQRVCVVDKDSPGGFKCDCNEGETEDGTGNCVGKFIY